MTTTEHDRTATEPTGAHRTRRGRRALVTAGLVAALVATGLGAGAGTALAYGSRAYSYTCGSRTPILHVTVYDSQPGHYKAEPDGAGSRPKEGDIPPNVPQAIPMPGGSGVVEVVVKGNDPGYFDETTKVTCDPNA